MLLALLLACAPEDTGKDPGDSGPGTVADSDGDGFSAEVDCDDASSAIHPGATELCDGLDNDCDQTVDDDAADAVTWWEDGDGDGFGAGVATTDCEPPTGAALADGDCDDQDADAHPGAPETCEDLDDRDCDGLPGGTDVDGDGSPACLDCDDGDAEMRPGADERCNGADDDCDGDVDEDAIDLGTWYLDLDGDGHGAGDVVQACEAPVGAVETADDCDDADPATHPGADESCDEDVDRNCDGSTLYADADGDGWAACVECDDGRADVHPGAVEVCDAADTDEDCSGAADDADADVDVATRATWYRDFDGDGYGDDTITTTACDAPTGYAGASGDCETLDADVHPGATEVCDAADVDEDCDGLSDDADPSTDAASWGTAWPDDDGDGFGDASSPVRSCDLSAGLADNGDDCDDGDAAISPDAAEVCDAANVDEDCDGAADDADTDALGTSLVPVDEDGDGHAGSATSWACDGAAVPTDDCDDADAGVHPGAAEACGGGDEDCDGLVDDADSGVTGGSTWYTDADGDGWGVSTTTTACAQPEGYAGVAGDCDDAEPTFNPGATERCSAGDEDCDGLEDGADPSMEYTTWYRDLDGDGFGGTVTRTDCAQPAGYVEANGDCDDTEESVNPGTPEVCDAANVDEDCDGAADDSDPDATGTSTWYADSDGDGYGVTASPRAACDRPSGYSATDGDCNDATTAIRPGATETCDGVDQDCDGATDDGLTLYYPDYDGDGYGDAVESGVCTGGSGWVTSPGDCDETDAAINPGEIDVCNGVDDDCDELVDADDPSGYVLTWYEDLDGDGYGDASTRTVVCEPPSSASVADGSDCDDADADVNPGEKELLGDTIDDNCDGATTYGTKTTYTSDISLGTSGATYTDAIFDHITITAETSGTDTYTFTRCYFYGSSLEILAKSLNDDAVIYLKDSYLWDDSSGAEIYVEVGYRGSTDDGDRPNAHIYVYNSTFNDYVIRTYMEHAAEVWFYSYNSIYDGGGFSESEWGYYWNEYYVAGSSNLTTSGSTDAMYLPYSDPMLDYSYTPPRPEPGSPAIDAAGSGATTTDYWNQTRSDPDIGAVENP